MWSYKPKWEVGIVESEDNIHFWTRQSIQIPIGLLTEIRENYENECSEDYHQRIKCDEESDEEESDHDGREWGEKWSE